MPGCVQDFGFQQQVVSRLFYIRRPFQRVQRLLQPFDKKQRDREVQVVGWIFGCGPFEEFSRQLILLEPEHRRSNPRRELEDYAPRHGWTIAERYENTISGAKSSRPELNRPMADARAKKLDIVLCWKLDRFGRSLRDCLNNLHELDSHGVRFIAITQNLDTDHRNPASRFMLHVLGAAAEFERELIRERSAAGRNRYLQDYRAGRVGNTVYSRSGKNMPPHRPKKIFSRDTVARLRAEGLSIRAIAARVGVGVGTEAWEGVLDLARGCLPPLRCFCF